VQIAEHSALHALSGEWAITFQEGECSPRVTAVFWLRIHVLQDMMSLLGTLLQDVVLMMCNVVSIMKVVLSKTSEVTL
jgi:hypothetical protein